MDMSIEKTEAFLKAIRTHAKEECQRIDTETEKVRSIRLKELENEAEKKYKDYVSYEVSRIAADTNREISQLQENARKKISMLRQSIFESVFENVKKELCAYQKTEAYLVRIQEDAKKLSKLLIDEVPELQIAESDKIHQDLIVNAFAKPCKVVVCTDILIGGIRGLDPISLKLTDMTLDAALEKEKAWFLEHSGLYVEE